ncbi:hypothetical protein BRADI_5g05173v3 [Brachypodium distachyon]|uniref:Uncharacterized protein n=1 Tax=Brachypodium distachyon TaxID=15368 RepID=A0A0Q3E2Q2_BRADI|nr:hypothetical protein BRADI_5g05173v3 [Brachypodium distachyon]
MVGGSCNATAHRGRRASEQSMQYRVGEQQASRPHASTSSNFLIPIVVCLLFLFSIINGFVTSRASYHCDFDI